MQSNKPIYIELTIFPLGNFAAILLLPAT